MDCEALRTNINELTSLRDALRQQIDELNNTRRGLGRLSAMEEVADAKITQLLDTYAPDFKEHNPDLFQLQLVDVYSLSDTGRVPPEVSQAVAEADSAGALSLKKFGVPDHLPGFKTSKGKDAEIRSACPLPGGANNYLLGGSRSTLYLAKKTPSGWQLGRPIKGFKNVDGGQASVDAMVALPDGSIMVGGYNRALSHYAPDAQGNWRLGKCIRTTEDYKYPGGNRGSVKDFHVLPDGDVLIARTDNLYRCSQQKGGWQLKEEIELNFRIGSRFAGYSAALNRLVATSPRELWAISGNKQQVAKLQVPAADAQFLRQHLDEIIAAGAA